MCPYALAVIRVFQQIPMCVGRLRMNYVPQILLATLLFCCANAHTVFGNEDTLVEESSQHWAFQPLGNPQPPDQVGDWSDHPIDRFVRQKQVESQIKPEAPADPRTLLRRVYFDLIGLPPTFEQIEAYRRDSSPDAFAHEVDTLLQSPYYGERWGRHWMDLVRYADTAGDNADYPIPEIHLYRNYIIDSFNADLPYDLFLREQLAGDLLAHSNKDERYAEQIIATGFIALSRRYGTSPYELQHLVLEDSIDATSRAFLGLTLRCARCHDHKSEPLTMEDYYGLYGIFASTQYPYTGSETYASLVTSRKNFVPLEPHQNVSVAIQKHQQQVENITQQIKAIRSGELGQQLAAAGERLKELNEKIQSAETTGQEYENLQQQLQALIVQRQQVISVIEEKEKKLREKLPRSDLPADLPAAYAVGEGEARDRQIQLSGQPKDLGEVVPRSVPKFFRGANPVKIPENHSGRLELAQWMTNPDSVAGAMLARVMANRVWQHHFGTGLVATPSNFGLSGSPPTHPELLEYLAKQFIDSGWSVKALHRLILSSKTYQLASTLDAKNFTIDPDNRTYWRFARRRLDAEALRDTMMWVGGSLNLGRPGQHPFPPAESWGYTQHAPFQEIYPSPHRSVYLLTQRFQRHPYLGLFDQPDTNTTTARRTSATVPLQSLFLMNNPWVQSQAQSLAGRILEHQGAVEDRIVHAIQLVYGRSPGEQEAALWRSYLEKVEAELANQNVPDPDRETETWTSLSKVLLTSNEFLYVD